MKIFKRVVVIGLAWFLIHASIIVIDGLTDSVAHADCILILGNTVNEDGTLSPRLKARVDKGLELYGSHDAHTIVVSGGLGKEGHYEGTAMKAYLVNNGVPADAIIVDDEGNTTLATANNYQLIATKNHYNSVIVVTQYFHIPRTRYIVKKKSNNTVYTAHAEYFELRDFYSIVREVVGSYVYWFR